jgi:N-acetylneuraminic acid mutarotase
MTRLGALLAAAVALAAPGSGWRLLPAAPVARVDEGPAGVWTGTRLIVVGRRTTYPANGVARVYLAAAYDPANDTWQRLPALPRSADGFYDFHAVWTGTAMLVWGFQIGVAYTPATNRWRTLPASPMPGAGLVVWTGRELIGWGGGCCGEAWSNGAAFDPARNRWRTLAPSPLHGAQHPVGVWTGHELVVFVGGVNPADGKPWPARLARAAAYDPATDTWRRIAPPPATREDATVVWDGHDVLLVGGYARTSPSPLPWRLARTVFAYDPRTNRWRSLAPLPSARRDFAAVWTGTELLVWAGTTNPGGGAASRPESPPRGDAYDPRTDRWTTLPRAPLHGRTDPVAVWTGRSLLVWGGGGLPGYRSYTDGAVLRR